MEREQCSVDEPAVGLERGRVLPLDVRSSDDVAAGHIPGSWLIPAAAIAEVSVEAVAVSGDVAAWSPR